MEYNSSRNYCMSIIHILAVTFVMPLLLWVHLCLNVSVVKMK